MLVAGMVIRTEVDSNSLNLGLKIFYGVQNHRIFRFLRHANTFWVYASYLKKTCLYPLPCAVKSYSNKCKIFVEEYGKRIIFLTTYRFVVWCVVYLECISFQIFTRSFVLGSIIIIAYTNDQSSWKTFLIFQGDLIKMTYFLTKKIPLDKITYLEILI